MGSAELNLEETGAPAEAADEVPGFLWLGLVALALLSLAGAALWGGWLASLPEAQLGDATWFFFCH